MKKKSSNLKPYLMRLDEILPIDEDIRKQEREFVKQFMKRSKMDFTEEDQVLIIKNDEFLYVISIIIREYETFRLNNPFYSPNK